MTRKMIKATVFAAAAMMMLSMTGCSLTSIQPNATPKALQDSVIESAPETESAVSGAAVVSEAEAPEEAVVESVVESAAETNVESVVEAPVPAVQPMEIVPTPIPDSMLKVMGEEKTGENVFKLRVANESGQNMIALAVRARSDGYDTATFEFEEDPFTDGERRILIYDGDKAVTEAKNGGDIVEFQITVTFDDGFTYKIGKIPFGDAKEIKVMRGDGYAYIIYASLQEEKMIDTENIERAKLGLDEIEIPEMEYEAPYDGGEAEPEAEASEEASEENEAEVSDGQDEEEEPFDKEAEGYEGSDDADVVG